MTITIASDLPFAERLLLFGGGGAGKTSAALSVAAHLARGHMHVIDVDYSMAYDRGLATEYRDAADRVTVHAPEPEWEPFTDTLAEVVASADPTNDWLVIDPISPSWDWVQGWYLETVYGNDLATHVANLRAAHAGDDDLKGYQAALLENMNWQVVKKAYEQKVWRQVQKWKGHLILCAEAKELGYYDSDKDTTLLFGPIQYKPVGEGRLKHIAATTLFLDHPKRDLWRMTTVKDRNRDELDKEPVEDFALDYLVGVAGWARAKGDA